MTGNGQETIGGNRIRRRRRLAISASSLLFAGAAILTYSGYMTNDNEPSQRQLNIFANDGIKYEHLTEEEHRALQSRTALKRFVDEKVARADWPPSSIVDNVADEHNRVAIVAVNCAGVQFADNWANSLLRQGVDNFIMIPLDNSTYTTLLDAYPGNTVPTLPGLENFFGHHLEEYNTFGSDQFKQLTASRPTFIKSFLKKGFSVLYNDADMAWRGNLWDEIDPDPSSAVEMESNDRDAFFVADGAPHYICSCMIFMRPTATNLGALTVWREEILTGKHMQDQAALNTILNSRWKDKLNWRQGDPVKFPAGSAYFNQEVIDPQIRENALLIHANWMQGGSHKKFKLELSGNWNPSGRLNPSMKCTTSLDGANMPQWMRAEWEKKVAALES